MGVISADEGSAESVEDLSRREVRALTETAGERELDCQGPSGPTTEHLDCQNCGKVADPRLKLTNRP